MGNLSRLVVGQHVKLIFLVVRIFLRIFLVVRIFLRSLDDTILIDA